VLAEAYECNILSNPWLAASIASKHSKEPEPETGISARKVTLSTNADQAPSEGGGKGATDDDELNDKPLTVLMPLSPGQASVPVESSSSTALSTPTPQARDLRSEQLADVNVISALVAMEATASDVAKEGHFATPKAPDPPPPPPPPRSPPPPPVPLSIGDAVLPASPPLSSLLASSQPEPLTAQDSEEMPSTKNGGAASVSRDDNGRVSDSIGGKATCEAAHLSGACAVGATGASLQQDPSPVSTSDATFGAPLRAQFMEATKVIRYHHGVVLIKEPGQDPPLDYLLNEVLLKYQRLKVRLLKISNQEAQFRLDLEMRVAQGIWNQYDITDDARKHDTNFVVYKKIASPPLTPSSRSNPSQSPRHILSAGSPRRMSMGDDQTVESYFVDTSGGRDVERAYMSMQSADGKRSASGKFEKGQVLPLTEWLLKHSSNPYPSMDDKAELAQKSGLSTQQVQNWFINMRKRHWTPMMNGKRRPRTFLDYVILSSQQGGKDEHPAMAGSHNHLGHHQPHQMQQQHSHHLQAQHQQQMQHRRPPQSHIMR